MKKWILFLVSSIALLFCIQSAAAKYHPILSIEPVSTAPISIVSIGASTLNYVVTNNTSQSVHHLQITPNFNIHSLVAVTVTSNTCTGSLAANATCAFTLNIQSVGITGSTTLMPRVCVEAGLDCSVPTLPNRVSVIVKTLQSIAITPVSPTITAAQQFTATGTYSDGSTANITSSVTWVSSATGVATIGASTGLATPVSAGTTNLTATLGSVVSPSNTVTVGSPALLSIAITPTSATIGSGDTQQFTAVGTYSYGSTQDITTSVMWASSNTSVATIGVSTGLATGVAAGSTNITATLSSITSNTAVLTTTASDPILIAAGVRGANAVLLQRDNSTGIWNQFPNASISGYTAGVGTEYKMNDCSGELCVAVGQKNTFSPTPSPVLVETRNAGASWTESLFGITGMTSSDHFNGGVSCTGSGATAICIAAGTVLVKTLDGGQTWSSQAVSGASGLYSSVNCRGSGSTALCIAGGGDAPNPVLVQSTNGAVTWSKVSIPAIDSVPGVIYGVGCNDDHTSCIAVGRLGLDDSSGSPVLVRTVDNGANWSVVSVSGAPSVGFFNKVSCTGTGSNTRCVAVGEDTSVFFAPVVAQASGISGSWSTVAVSGAAAHVNLRAVSCTGSGSSATCIAAGQDFTSHFGPAAFQTVNGGSSWSNITSPNPPFFTSPGLFSSAQCVMINGTPTCKIPGENDTTFGQMLLAESIGGVWSIATTNPATIPSTFLY